MDGSRDLVSNRNNRDWKIGGNEACEDRLCVGRDLLDQRVGGEARPRRGVSLPDRLHDQLELVTCWNFLPTEKGLPMSRSSECRGKRKDRPPSHALPTSSCTRGPKRLEVHLQSARYILWDRGAIRLCSQVLEVSVGFTHRRERIAFAPAVAKMVSRARVLPGVVLYV